MWASRIIASLAAACTVIARRPVSRHVAQAVPLDLEHLFDQPDMADEKAADLLRQRRQDKTIVLVARPHQWPHIRSRTQIDAIR
jgi:hypothetical protein